MTRRKDIDIQKFWKNSNFTDLANSIFHMARREYPIEKIISECKQEFGGNLELYFWVNFQKNLTMADLENNSNKQLEFAAKCFMFKLFHDIIKNKKGGKKNGKESSHV